MPKTATKRPLSDAEKAKRRKDALGVLDYPGRALAQGKALYGAGKSIITEGLGSLIAGAEYAGDRSVTKDVPKDINRLGKMVAQNAGGYADAGNALWQMVKGDGKQAVPDYYRNKAGQAYQEQFNPSPADPRLERFGNFYADPLAVGVGAGRAVRGVADPKLWRGIAEDMAQGAQSNVIRRYGIPESAGELISQYTTTGALKRHPAYEAAKHGDENAGYDMARDMIGSGIIRKIEGIKADNPHLLPMYTPEKVGRNAIPNGMALYLSDRTGLPIELGVAQVNNAGHTGAAAMDRMVNRAQFDGWATPGANYIALDDVVTMGGTLAEASNFVRGNGADIAGVMALTNKGKGSILTPDNATIDALRKKHGSLIEDELGIVPEALTRAEADYLSMFGSPNTLRAKILAAKAAK